MYISKRYEKYKPSNVDFIGDIPEHWEVRKLKYIANIYRGAILRPVHEPSYFNEDGEWTYLNIGDIDKNKRYIESGKLRLSTIGDKKSCRVYPNNIVLTASATIGEAYINKIKICIHDGFIAFTDIQINKIYLNYYLNNPLLYIALGKTGTQKNLYLGEVKSIYIPLPSDKEQIKIANFLDIKNRQIEEFIKDKQTQIALLEEQKEAIINKAVTKGLDDSVEFKNSGIEWIGDIPKSWEVSKLKYVMNIIRTGSTPDTGNKDFFNGNINWFKPEDLNNKILNNSKEKVTQLAVSMNKVKYLAKDSILVVAIGATTGKTSYLNVDATFNQQITGFNSSINNNKYYFYTLKNFTKVFLNLASYTTLAILNNEFFKSFIVPLPPLNEQKQIIKYIETQTTKIDKLINQIQKECDLIKEYKISLISEVVTGQIKIEGIRDDL